MPIFLYRHFFSRFERWGFAYVLNTILATYEKNIRKDGNLNYRKQREDDSLTFNRGGLTEIYSMENISNI